MREVGFTPFAIGPYRCEERLRAGGIGDLYLATHLPTGSQRCLWQLPAEVLDDPEAAAQLLQVQLRVQTLSHPNIQIVHDVIRKEVEIYVALEHHPGVTLLQVLRKLREVGPFAPAVAGFLVWQVCLALDHVHHLKHDGRPAPLIHGALWPQSVLCSFKGEVRLGGFGTWVIPRTESEEVSIRTQFSYRSPEHVSGEPLSRSSDLFCVGVLLAEMLLARPLLLGETLMETVERVERAEIPDLGGIAPLLQKVIRRCLAQRPSDRYADIAAFISELGVVVHGMGDRSVRQDLVTFLNNHFQESSRAPTRPAPLPGAEDDETTNISPRDLADALRELSRERTEPGRLPKRLPEKLADLQPIENDTDGGEPTRVDHGFVPEPLSGVTAAELEADEGPTALSAPPQITVTWEEAPRDGGRATDRLLSTDPGSPALFPPEEDERTATSETSPEVLTSLRKEELSSASSPHLPAAPFDPGFADDETTTHGMRAGESVADEEPTANKRHTVDSTTNPSPVGRLAATLVEDPTRDSVVDELPTNRLSPVLVEELGNSRSTEEVPTQNAKPAGVRSPVPRLDPRRNREERTPVVPVESLSGEPHRSLSGPTGPVQPVTSPRRDPTGRAPALRGDAAVAPRRDPTGRAPALRGDAAAAPRRDPTGRPPPRAGSSEAPRHPTPPRGPRPASSPSERGPAGAPRRDPTGRMPPIPAAPRPGPPSPPPGAARRPSSALPVPPRQENPGASADRGVGGLPTLEAQGGSFFPAQALAGAAPDRGALAPTLPPTEMEFPHADEVGSEASQEATSAVSGADPGLFFEGPNVADAEAPSSAPAAGPESFDPDAFSAAYYSTYGASQGIRGKSFRFTLAHGMLLVAILVFLVAVALLVRRVVVQRRGRTPPTKVARAPDARAPASEPISSARPDSGVPKKPGPTRPGPTLPAGKLRIEVDPALPRLRASLYLDRKRVGWLPLTTSVPARATVDLLVDAAGFVLHQERVEMPANRGLEVRVKLKPGSYPQAMKRNGTLFLRCKKKDGRRIFIDGQDTGISCTKLHYFRLARGKHRVQLYSIAKDKRILYLPKIKARKRTTIHVTR